VFPTRLEGVKAYREKDALGRWQLQKDGYFWHHDARTNTWTRGDKLPTYGTSHSETWAFRRDELLRSRTDSWPSRTDFSPGCPRRLQRGRSCALETHGVPSASRSPRLRGAPSSRPPPGGCRASPACCSGFRRLDRAGRVVVAVDVDGHETRRLERSDRVQKGDRVV
jgi:hypothetical protein